jgi:hypothetical protein
MSVSGVGSLITCGSTWRPGLGATILVRPTRDRTTAPPATPPATWCEPDGPVASEELARRLVEQARTEGLNLIGPAGLLGDLPRKC